MQSSISVWRVYHELCLSVMSTPAPTIELLVFTSDGPHQLAQQCAHLYTTCLVQTPILTHGVRTTEISMLYIERLL